MVHQFIEKDFYIKMILDIADYLDCRLDFHIC